MAKNTICLWYDGDAEAAARFYAETFPDSTLGAVHRAPGDYPSGKKGDVLIVRLRPQLSKEANMLTAATSPTAPVPVLGKSASQPMTRCAGAQAATT